MISERAPVGIGRINGEMYLVDERGSVIVDDQGATRLPAHAITPVDTTSCGDSYCAGFIAGLDRGWSVIEAARLAYDETQGRSVAIGHTLACVYAASGKPREARDLLLKGMEQVGITRPDDSAWYGFGLVAEAYGDAESARDYYAHVQKPKKGVIQASSVYALSQARLAAPHPADRAALDPMQPSSRRRRCVAPPLR